MDERELREMAREAVKPIAAAMAVRCPACGAGPGEKCHAVGATARRMDMPHMTRWKAAAGGSR